MLFRSSVFIGLLMTGLVISLPLQVFGATCSGATYKGPDFEQEVTEFSPFDTIYLILDCSGLRPGEHVMHANWIHQKRGTIRSDKYEFRAEDGRKRGIFFWFKLNKKGPMASMLSNQDFHEENFGDWAVEAYLDDQLLMTESFKITEDVSD